MRVWWLGVTAITVFAAIGNVYAESSAEAILDGLARAASNELALQETKSEPVSVTYVCKKITVVREIRIEYAKAETGYACQVIYDSEAGIRTLWRARNQASYCQPHAAGLIRKLQDANWSCTR